MALLDELLVRIGMDTSGVDEGTEEVTSKLDKMAGPAALAGAAAGGALALGLSAAMDISGAQSKLQDQLGLTQAEAERAGSLAGDVYSDGWGESMDEIADSMGAVVSSMGKLGDFTDAELEDMSKSALALANRFEIDVADAAQAAGAMINNGLAKDGTEAFDVLTAAAQTLPKQMLADIPATVNEYGKHWARIGLDGKDAMAMMSQYVKAGGRDIDQAGDVLHEFARITSEETGRASDALKALGLPASKMLADIHKGGAPAKAALQKTIEGLRGVKDPAKQAELGVALFGDMAGEGAAALWAMDPATAAATTGLDKAAGASKALTDSMEADPAQQMDAAMRTLSVGLGEALLPVLMLASGFMAEHKGLMQALVPVILVLAVALGVAAIAQWVMNSAMFASPVTWIILGIVALVAVIILIATKTSWFGDAWRAVWGAIKTAWDWIVRVVWNPLVNFFTHTLPDGVATGLKWVQDKWNSLVTWVTALPGRISRAASGMWDSIVSSFKAAVNRLIGMWNGLSFTLGGGSFMGADIPSVTLSTPDLPYLAEGGVTTGPALAVIGEGREDEAVLPLSRLEQMITTGQDMRAPSVTKVEPVTVRTVLELTGADSAFKNFFVEVVRNTAGGDVVRFAEG